ncbi:MAG: response regulator [Desulfobulbaceae bacterium]|nr:response regulator [Desulfobulbaceae bacterium]
MSDAENPTFSILIVDDEPVNIQLLGNLLIKNNYEVEFALSGEKALEWINNKPFDLVLMDIMMPGMDGYEVCSKMKNDCGTQHIPVIFITAKTETKDIVKGFDVGGSDYVAKPFRAPELLARVKKEVELKTLRGLIPICAHCKNIRDDQGVWNKIEAYIQEHSAALFSHSICPQCIQKLYDDEEEE